MRPHLSEREVEYLEKRIKRYNKGEKMRDVSLGNYKFYMQKTLMICNGMNSGTVI
jgi:hypothetical protein